MNSGNEDPNDEIESIYLKFENDEVGIMNNGLVHLG